MTQTEAAWRAKARRKLCSARLILNDGGVGAASSFTFYAMFYCASAARARQGRTYSSPSAVIDAFDREFANSNQLPPELCGWLRAPKEVQVRGDYGSPSDVSSETAATILQQATEFAAATGGYLGGTPLVAEPV